MVDGCSLLSAVVVGNSSFANFAINTSSAKLVSFTTGSTQTVTGLLSLLGAESSLLQIRSTLSGSLALFNVTGSSSASFVNVDDNDAQPGNDIFLPANSVKGSNTPGWLSASQVPLLGPVAMGLLMLLLLGSGQRGLFRSTRMDPTL